MNFHYNVNYDASVLKQLSKLDKTEARKILSWISKNLINCIDPRIYGKQLQGNVFGSLWRYRIGDYRILCNINDKAVLILVVSVGHRKDVYK